MQDCKKGGGKIIGEVFLQMSPAFIVSLEGRVMIFLKPIKNI